MALAHWHGSLCRAQALEIAGERGIAAAVAILLQYLEQLATVTVTVVPVLEHDMLPRIEQAAPGATADSALGKVLAAQVAEHG